MKRTSQQRESDKKHPARFSNYNNGQTQGRELKYKRCEEQCLNVRCQEYDRKFPYFREPKEVGTFSKNSERQFCHDKSQLKYFSPPLNPRRCSFDLKHGYSNMVWKDRTMKEYLNNLLRWIMHNKRNFCLNNSSTHIPSGDSTKSASGSDFKSLNTDFFSWRGLLTMVACAPYEKRDDFLIGIIKFRGSYFMCEFETEAKKRERDNETPRQKEMCAWGFKFEQYVTSDKPEGQPDLSHPVNTNEEFGSVARSRLGSHSLVYGAEVDCVEPDSRHRNQYLELKTSRIIEAKRQYENFCRYKLLKWWAQSFLIGIPKVVCGFRDDDGVVRELQEFPVLEMPAKARDTLHNCWKPSVCFNFLDTFLQFVKSCIKEDNSRCVYLFRWQPGQDVVCECKGDDPEFLFLPDWFINWAAWDQPINS